MSSDAPGTSPHRATKFTPENIRQITNLVDRGRSVEEIAEIIGVTPGTLRVTCSRLHISLRRQFTRTPMRRGQRSAPRQRSAGQLGNDGSGKSLEVKPMAKIAVSAREDNVRPAVMFTLVASFGGREIKTEVPVTLDAVGRLAIEAETRGLKMGELLAELFRSAVQEDVFGVVLNLLDRRTRKRLKAATVHLHNGA
jgi:hypothetical protein